VIQRGSAGESRRGTLEFRTLGVCPCVFRGGGAKPWGAALRVGVAVSKGVLRTDRQRDDVVGGGSRRGRQQKVYSLRKTLCRNAEGEKMDIMSVVRGTSRGRSGEMKSHLSSGHFAAWRKGSRETSSIR